MVEEKYSAGLISQSFWFIEIKKILRLIREGKREDEIKNFVQKKISLVLQTSIGRKEFMAISGIE